MSKYSDSLNNRNRGMLIAAAIAMLEVFAHLRSPSRRPLRVVFVLFDDTTFDAFSRAADRNRHEDERVE